MCIRDRGKDGGRERAQLPLGAWCVAMPYRGGRGKSRGCFALDSDTVEVYVISADKEKKKISLGMKDRSQDPWTVFTSTYEVGDVANVRVVKLMTFGAFAEIVPGVDGLIHISQIADHRIEKPGDVLAEGDKVDVKITDVDMENQKVSLSIRALLEEAPAGEDEE